MIDPMSTPPSGVFVILGNAGIKSLAALPILEFLHKEKKIPIDLIIGSGGGATLAALLGSGYTFEEIPEKMNRFYDRKNIMKISSKTVLELAGVPLGKFNPGSAILKNKIICGLSKEFFSEKQIKELFPKVFFQVTELFSGEGFLLTQGSVADAVCASSALYPFLPPINIEDQWYVDGMYSSTLPLLEATKRDAKVIIAIDFSRSHHALPHGLIEYYANSLNRTCATMHSSQVSIAMMLQDIEIVLIKIAFASPINLWDSDCVDEILQAGYKALEVHHQELCVALNGSN